jgi:hypothetical protein
MAVSLTIQAMNAAAFQASGGDDRLSGAPGGRGESLPERLTPAAPQLAHHGDGTPARERDTRRGLA